MPLPVTDTESALMLGPTLSGRRRLFHLALSTMDGRAVVVSTRQPEPQVRQTHVSAVTGQASDGGVTESTGSGAADFDPVDGGETRSDGGVKPVVVDCLSGVLEREVADTEMTKYADDPSNLTSIGTKFTEVLSERRDEACVVGITDLTPLIVYRDPKQVFQFVHLIIQKSAGAGWPVVATMDPAAHDDMTVNRLISLFDRVIETRLSEDGTQEFRVRGPSGPDWQPIQSV